MSITGAYSILSLKNTSHSVTAAIEVPVGGAEGVIMAQGGNIGGWALYMKGGKLKYRYNLLGIDYYYAESVTPLAPGDHQVRMEFAYEGGGLGKGGTATLFVDGAKVGEDDLSATASPVSPDYGHHKAFTGRIKGVQLAIADAADREAPARVI